MKKKKGPLILICVLVLLLILYFVLSTWNKKQDSKEEETVKVTDLKTSKITGVKYDLGTGEMNFEKDGDTWYYTADKDFPLRQSYPKTVADAMGQLNADRELEDADALIRIHIIASFRNPCHKFQQIPRIQICLCNSCFRKNFFSFFICFFQTY